ncbi:MAG: hypothetical protein ACOX0V_01250 [Bacteroidales bacterium]|jgi:hypothetical protein
MNTTFSIRHKKLIEQNKLKLYLNVNQKTKILYLLNDYNESFYETTDTNWNYTETTLEKVYADLLRAYGFKTLKSFVNDEFIEVKNLDEFLIGTKPEYVIDSIEFFYKYITDSQRQNSFTKDLNQILKNEEIQLRFIEGEFFRLDSEFAESDILFKTSRLLKTESFDKSLSDFLDARQRLSQGDFSGSIISANNALESFLKKLLDKKNENQGVLKKLLIKSKLIPDYFNGFLDYFEGLLQSSFTIANKSSRHGQKDLPTTINEVDEPIASFCLNLVGTLIIFITDRYIETKPKIEKQKENLIKESPIDENDLPF